jgi:hypothetical protein
MDSPRKDRHASSLDVRPIFVFLRNIIRKITLPNKFLLAWADHRKFDLPMPGVSVHMVLVSQILDSE